MLPAAPLTVFSDLANLITDLPDSTAVPTPQPEQPLITMNVEKVWADGAIRLYYTDKCAEHPPDAYRIAKSRRS